MRVTTQMLNETARKARLPINNSTLLDYINNDSSADSMLNSINGSTSAATQMLKAKVSKTGYENTDKSSEDLQNAIDKLAGEKSTVFKDARESKDTSKVTAAVQELIDKYNSLVEVMSKTSSSLDEFYKKALKGLPESIKESLEKVGITYNSDGTLEVDSDKLKKADVDSLEKILGSDSEFMKKLSFVTDRIESNAEANLQSVSSTYSSTADIMSSFNSSKYDFLG